MVRTRILRSIGFWSGGATNARWPDVRQFVDVNWDPDERDQVANYLQSGLVVRSYMGYSPCRLCGKDNGDLELSDGAYVWPDGLAHYILEHGVRLPDQFVQHAIRLTEELEEASRDEVWWQTVGASPARRTQSAVDGSAFADEV